MVTSIGDGVDYIDVEVIRGLGFNPLRGRESDRWGARRRYRQTMVAPRRWEVAQRPV